MRNLGIFAVCLLITPVAVAQVAPKTTGQRDPVSTPLRLFAVIYRPGPSWVPGQPMSRQNLGGHLRYYRQGVSDGRVYAGGGLMAINGGLAILTLQNLEEAERFLASDPAILNGTFVGEVHEWTPGVMAAPLRP